MATLREKLAASDTTAAMRLVVDAKPQLFSKVAELRAAHLQGGGELSDRTRDSYASDAARVAKAGGDPVALAGTYASFRKLRAACMWKAREDLRECLAKADRARKKGGTGEIEALCLYDERLPAIEQRMALLASCKFDPARATRQDKTHMQRHKLGRLPKDWIARVHHRTKGGIYGEAVALGILVPVRPDEIAQRVRVKIDEAGALVFQVQGSKLRAHGSGVAAHVQGIGQPVRWLTLSAVDPARQEVFDWLRDRVQDNGGKLTIGGGLSARGICSAFRAMSRREFPRHKAPPSFYALRHAASAELKAAGLDADEVAQGMGHASTVSQKAYGMRSQGSGSYRVKAEAAEQVRAPKIAAISPSRTQAPVVMPMRRLSF
ncbi:MAG: hypothetical protein Q7T39_00170 [Polaromonas sp.]|nr:hypothetical protein [Polaromonas sp.]